MEGFAERLHELRCKTSLSTEQIDKMLGLEDKIEGLEAGIIEPTVDDIIMLAGFYCVSSDYLLGTNNNVCSMRINDMLQLPDDFPHEIFLDSDGNIYKDDMNINNNLSAIAMNILSEAVK